MWFAAGWQSRSPREKEKHASQQGCSLALKRTATWFPAARRRDRFSGKGGAPPVAVFRPRRRAAWTVPGNTLAPEFFYCQFDNKVDIKRLSRFANSTIFVDFGQPQIDDFRWGAACVSSGARRVARRLGWKTSKGGAPPFPENRSRRRAAGNHLAVLLIARLQPC